MTDCEFVRPNFKANLISPLLIIPAKKADAKASPAPVVSTTFTLLGL